eukprot:139353-Pyramimonas_sp.AAC.1
MGTALSSLTQHTRSTLIMGIDNNGDLKCEPPFIGHGGQRSNKPTLNANGFELTSVLRDCNLKALN